MSKKLLLISALLTVLFALNLFAVERSEIPDKYKWKLTDIYPTIEAWQKDYDAIDAGIDKLAAFKGKFAGENAGNPAGSMVEFEKLSKEVNVKFEKVYIYVARNYHLTLTSSEWAGRLQQCQMLGVKYGEKLAWFEPEILKIPQETMHKYIAEKPELKDYKKSYDDLYALQAHVLSEAEERILALSGNITGTAGDIYGKFTDADMKFGYIQDDKGDSIEVTDSGWVSWRTDKNRRIREEYFKKIWNNYNSFGTSFSAMMDGNLKKDVYLTKASHYDNTLNRALSTRFIPETVYINLVETTKANTAPLHKYNEIRKRVLGVDHYRHWDYYVSIVEMKEEERYTWEEGVNIVLDALKPMGDQYLADITYALNPENGWVDPYAHAAKRGGAYSGGCYSVHGFMLYNFDLKKGLTYNDVSTVCHEVGHSMHSLYSEKNQAFPNKDYAIFNAEVASTCNEAIMSMTHLDKARKEYKEVEKNKKYFDAKYMGNAKYDAQREDYTKKKNKLMYLLESNIDNVRQTYYRQTLFATWEWEAHKMAEEGKPLTKESLSAVYGDLLKEFHGPAAEYEELSSMSWARIPHFYYGYYVYSYATSYAASLVLAKDIVAEYKGDKSKKGSRDKFIAFLSSGSSKHPVELLADAGVDMNTPAPFKALIAQVSTWVEELDALTQ